MGGNKMNIDLDIKITKEDGENEQCFIKHFSGKLNPFEGIPQIKSDIDKNFEDFLSEFLSNSGQIIRKNLLGMDKGETAREYTQSKSLKGEELEYTLKLGTGQRVSGRIPLQDLNLFSAPEVISGIMAEKKPDRTAKNQPFLLNGYFPQTNQKLRKESLGAVAGGIQNAMQKAIQMYEYNICYF